MTYSFVFLLIIVMQTLRRLAQNREAARKSRLRKKVCPVWSFVVFSHNPLLLFRKAVSAKDRSVFVMSFNFKQFYAFFMEFVVFLFSFAGICTTTGEQPAEADSTGARAPESPTTGLCFIVFLLSYFGRITYYVLYFVFKFLDCREFSFQAQETKPIQWVEMVHNCLSFVWFVFCVEMQNWS